MLGIHNRAIGETLGSSGGKCFNQIRSDVSRWALQTQDDGCNITHLLPGKPWAGKSVNPFEYLFVRDARHVEFADQEFLFCCRTHNRSFVLMRRGWSLWANKSGNTHRHVDHVPRAHRDRYLDGPDAQFLVSHYAIAFRCGVRVLGTEWPAWMM
jgi:hypothetical protein